MRIDPNKLLENQEYPVTVDFQNTIAAELKRLYALEDATTPFKDRAALEWYLNNCGLECYREMNSCDRFGSAKFYVQLDMDDATIVKYAFVLLKCKIAFLTPALLDSILEAK